MVALHSQLPDAKQQQNIFSKLGKALPEWLDTIDASFLSTEFKDRYKEIIRERMERLK
jgi:serine/threonine-protein kinase HipA